MSMNRAIMQGDLARGACQLSEASNQPLANLWLELLNSRREEQSNYRTTRHGI